MADNDNDVPTSIHFSQGSLLIGAYFNLVIYTLNAIGFYLYFKSKRSKTDSLCIRSIVILAIVADTLGTLGTLAACYIICINYSRHDLSIEAPFWSLTLWWMCNILASTLVQYFMLRRFWLLSKNTIVIALISMVMLASKGAMLYVGIVTLSKARNLRTRYHDTASVAVALGATSATDILITIALILQLSHWSSRAHTDSSKRMVHTIASMAITTGGVTSAISITELILFAICPSMRISTGIGFVVGRVYVATMLFTLLYRDHIADIRHSNRVNVDPETSMNTPDIENGPRTPALVHFKPQLDTLHIESTNLYTDTDSSLIQTPDTIRFGHHSNLNLPTPIDDSEVVLGRADKKEANTQSLQTSLSP